MAAKTKKAVRRAQLRLHKALSHETRIDILTYLSEHSTGSASDMAREFGETPGHVSHHLKQLEKWSFVEQVEERPVKKGTAEKVYAATSRVLLSDREIEELPPAARQMIAGQVFERTVGDVVEGFKGQAFDELSDWHLSRTLFSLDREGWIEMRQLHERTLDEALEIQGRSFSRLEETGEQPIQVSGSQLCFRLPGR